MPLPLDVVILAAGKGTRMYSDRPKVLHRLAGKSLLDHVLDAALELDPAQVCVIYGFGGDAVPAALSPRSNLRLARQEPQLGTGHALQQALPYLGEARFTLVLYGDVPLIGIPTLLDLVQAALPGKLALLTQELDDPTGYGRIRRQAGRVVGIVEEKDATSEQRAIREVNTGMMVVPNEYLPGWLARLRSENAQGEYYLTDVIALAASEGIEVVARQPTFAWEVLGVNSKEQLAALERTYQETQATRLLAQGVTLADPRRIDVRGELRCGRDVEIDVNCIFEGVVSLADGVSIGPNCVIRDTTVGSGTRVEAFSHIDRADVGSACRVGPYARVRPDTHLAPGVHIGNFVETKNTTVGAGSKINHLSYVGDASVGSGVNVGAGTITCNYDGARKHRTVIEDDVFVGSATQLVAPVSVGRGATIGAGSTVTRDVPAGELTLSRSKQVTVPGWKRPAKADKE